MLHLIGTALVHLETTEHFLRLKSYFSCFADVPHTVNFHNVETFVLMKKNISFGICDNNFEKFGISDMEKNLIMYIPVFFFLRTDLF